MVPTHALRIGHIVSAEEDRRAANPVALHPVRLAYQPPTSSTFLSEQTSHQQPVSSTFLSEQISTGHRPPARRTSCSAQPKRARSMNERLTTQTKSYCILCTTIRNAPLRRLCRSRRNPSRKKKESTHQRVWLNGTITDTTRSSFSSSVQLPRQAPPYVPSRCDCKACLFLALDRAPSCSSSSIATVTRAIGLPVASFRKWYLAVPAHV
jgi:hypothetical protein